MIRLVPAEHLNKLKLRDFKKDPPEISQISAANPDEPTEEYSPIKKRKKDKITVFPE